MIISEFRIGASHTVNLGDYNSVRVEAQIVVNVPEGEDLALLKVKAQDELRALLEETYKAQTQKRKT